MSDIAWPEPILGQRCRGPGSHGESGVDLRPRRGASARPGRSQPAPCRQWSLTPCVRVAHRTGVAYNPADQHLFFSDDTGTTKRVYELDPGPDGLYDTPDDIVTSFDTTAFGSTDPEGVTYNTVQGVLHIVDGVNEEVYTVDPGVNGVFDGVPPAGDDQVASFDTTVLGVGRVRQNNCSVQF